MSKIIALKDSKVAFIGHGVSCMSFEKTGQNENILKKQNKNYLSITCGYNQRKNEFIICCSNEIKIIDFFTGRCKRIFLNIFNSESEDELTRL